MSFHPEILSPKQRKTLHLLGPEVTARDFYLAGGTALALHLGHRRSVDFDWFLEGGMPDPLLLAREIQETVPFVTTQVEPGTLFGTVNGVRVSFFEFRYPMLDPAVPLPDHGCRLASLRDLACMKLSAIAQRGSKKDFVDLFALGREGFELPDMLDWYRTKFGIEDIGHVLYALAYFDDADRERMPRMLWKVEWKEVKDVIRAWTRQAGWRSRS
jgi:hypothetical protein